MLTYLYIRAVPLIAYGYTGVILGIHRYYKELWHAQGVISKCNYTLFFPNCYYFVYRRVPMITPVIPRPPRPLSYPQVIHKHPQVIHRLPCWHGYCMGFHRVKCGYASGYLWSHHHCMNTQVDTSSILWYSRARVCIKVCSKVFTRSIIVQSIIV